MEQIFQEQEKSVDDTKENFVQIEQCLESVQSSVITLYESSMNMTGSKQVIVEMIDGISATSEENAAVASLLYFLFFFICVLKPQIVLFHFLYTFLTVLI